MTIALVVPSAAVFVAQLFGHTFLDGDNLIQNLPMRYLTGRDLAHGFLPLWNPYLFGGTPLLGGFNAGSAYPATWLMAVVPLFTAWSLTVALAYDIALVGMYAFLRRQAIASTPATIGAVTFTFAGYMTGQLVHIDLIEGAAWLPWMLLAIHALTDPSGPWPRTGEERRARRGWATLLAVALGLTLLAGGAEAIIDSGVLVGIYWIGRIWTMDLLARSQRPALRSSLIGMAGGLVGGIAFGAAQWAPGLQFLSQSQRAATSYGYFTSGSLDNRLLTLLVSPFALGTNQGFPAKYQGDYNFPEVTSYAGIFALIAVCSLFLRRYRRRPEARHWWVWYVILVVGLLSSLGAETPFARLMYMIPGISSERLLNRNLLLVDVALAVLLAWWTQALFDQQPVVPAPGAVAAPTWRARMPVGRAERLVTVAPAAIMVLFALFLWVDGGFLQRLLDIAVAFHTPIRIRLAVLVTVQAAVGVAATWVVLTRASRTRRSLIRAVGVVLFVDLALFNAFVVSPPISEANALAATPQAAQFQRLVGDGRFIIYDPDRFFTPELFSLGQTDFNIYRQLESAQGYTALTDGHFYELTGSHYMMDLNPETLAGTTWDGLNVTTLLSVPAYFVTPVAPAEGVPPASSDIDFPSDIDTFRDSPNPPATSAIIKAGRTRPWYLGGVLTVSSWSVPVEAGTARSLRIGVVTPSGGTRWLPRRDLSVVGSRTAPRVQVTLPADQSVAGIVVGTGKAQPATIGIPVAGLPNGAELALNGRMQTGVTSPHWTFSGTIGQFGIFTNTRSRGWAWLDGATGGPAPPESTVSEAPPGLGGGQTIVVHTTGAARLVRSASWSTGWHATVERVTIGADDAPLAVSTTSAVVTRNGVVQQVALPAAGEYRVTFRYRPTVIGAGLVVSVLAGLGFLAWWAVEWVVARRRRRRA
jgi:hypothetical protein